MLYLKFIYSEELQLEDHQTQNNSDCQHQDSSAGCHWTACQPLSIKRVQKLVSVFPCLHMQVW